MNAIYENIAKARGGYYCHALEISTAYEFGEIIAQIAEETARLYDSEDEHKKDLIDFFQTIEVYYLPEDGEDENEIDRDELYNFSVKTFIEDYYSSFNCYFDHEEEQGV